MGEKGQSSEEEREAVLGMAQNYIARGRHLFAPNLEDLVEEFTELNIGHSRDMWELIAELLEEIATQKDRTALSFSKGFLKSLNCEIFSFVWRSKKLKQFLCLQFSLKNKTFYYFSLRKKNSK